LFILFWTKTTDKIGKKEENYKKLKLKFIHNGLKDIIMDTVPTCFTYLPDKSERVKDVYYIYKEDIVFWDGKRLKCQHKRERSKCKECGGSSICEHKRIRSRCKECGGSGICEHKRQRRHCKECGGSSICEHNRIRSSCKECGGSQTCEHNRQRSSCKECGGRSICEHNKVRSVCKECGGGSICQHNRRRRLCKECGGSGICQHNRERRSCKICDPNGHLTMILRSRVYYALKSYNKKKEQKTLEYLGCTLGELTTYLETKFEEGMTWENQGEWHIDHIKPCASFNLDNEEEIAQCFHFSNLQPLWGEDNLIKHDFYDDDMEWTEDNGWIFK